MLVEVLTDLRPAIGMNGGLIVFVEETDQLGGTLQVLHNITTNSGDKHRNAVFAYYNDVEDGDVESIPFQKSMLAETYEVTVPNMMVRLLQHYTTTKTLDLVGLYAEGVLSSKRSPPAMPCSPPFP